MTRGAGRHEPTAHPTSASVGVNRGLHGPPQLSTYTVDFASEIRRIEQGEPIGEPKGEPEVLKT